jgi:glycerophosphoryl diester phosphodiesterase
MMTMKRTLFTVVSCIAVAVSGGNGRTPVAENGITAHRGDSCSFPENSLRAFSAGNSSGADWIETDVRTTSDGKLVLMHNATTEAYCSIKKTVAECTYEELRNLDLAEKFRIEHKLTLEQCPRQEIILLEDALNLILKERKARISLQPKSDCVDQIMEIVRRKGALKWVGFNDMNLKKMARVKELEPSVTVFWDRGKSDIDEDIKIAKRHGFEYIVLYREAVTSDKVKKLHDAGFKVGVWTENNPNAMEKFLDMGIDRIYTDAPCILKKLIFQRNTTRQG